jgi:TRAP-type mannitol/chloroaromatic compound transport system permease small subunit
MHTLEKLAAFFDRLSELAGRAVAWLTLGMVLVTFVVVVLRYMFSLGWIAMQESITYMHALVFLLGAAYTLKHDGHVRVDIFYRGLGTRAQAGVDLAGTLLLLIPVCVFILWVSWDYVAVSWSLKESSREAGGLPFVYVLKSAILAMGVMLLLQGIAQALRCILVLTGHREAGPSHGVEEPEV